MIHGIVIGWCKYHKIQCGLEGFDLMTFIGKRECNNWNKQKYEGCF